MAATSPWTARSGAVRRSRFQSPPPRSDIIAPAMPSNDDDADKRKSDREAVTLFVEYEGADDLVGDYTENLSSGGTFVATNRELPIGTQIQLVLSFPGLLSA